MPSEDTNYKDTKEFNQHQKSDTTPFIIYADLEFFIKRIDGCKNKFEKSSTTVGEHITYGGSMCSIWTLDGIEKQDIYRGQDCMKRFCESLTEHSMKIINF